MHPPTPVTTKLPVSTSDATSKEVNRKIYKIQLIREIRSKNFKKKHTKIPFFIPLEARPIAFKNGILDFFNKFSKLICVYLFSLSSVHTLHYILCKKTNYCFCILLLNKSSLF